MATEKPNHAAAEEPSRVLRRGKWLDEEIQLVEAVVRMFTAGLIPQAGGKTLRMYLAGLLKCEPMRITKRFSGLDSVGKKPYVASGTSSTGTSDKGDTCSPTLVRVRKELEELQVALLGALERTGGSRAVKTILDSWDAEPHLYSFAPLTDPTASAVVAWRKQRESGSSVLHRGPGSSEKQALPSPPVYCQTAQPTFAGAKRTRYSEAASGSRESSGISGTAVIVPVPVGSLAGYSAPDSDRSSWDRWPTPLPLQPEPPMHTQPTSASGSRRPMFTLAPSSRTSASLGRDSGSPTAVDTVTGRTWGSLCGPPALNANIQVLMGVPGGVPAASAAGSATRAARASYDPAVLFPFPAAAARNAAGSTSTGSDTVTIDGRQGVASHGNAHDATASAANEAAALLLVSLMDSRSTTSQRRTTSV